MKYPFGDWIPVGRYLPEEENVLGVLGIAESAPDAEKEEK